MATVSSELLWVSTVAVIPLAAAAAIWLFLRRRGSQHPEECGGSAG